MRNINNISPLRSANVHPGDDYAWKCLFSAAETSAPKVEKFNLRCGKLCWNEVDAASIRRYWFYGKYSDKFEKLIFTSDIDAVHQKSQNSDLLKRSRFEKNPWRLVGILPTNSFPEGVNNSKAMNFAEHW